MMAAEQWQRTRREAHAAERSARVTRYAQLAKHLLVGHWGLWLALGLAAVLRLWNLQQSQFFNDQAGLMTLARESVLYRALPITGIPSSIGTLNPPLSIDLLLPFARLTDNPVPSLVTLALWNVLGVALLYVFTLRYAGRVTATVAALLFACASAPVSYSRFLWQQNYLPPVLALWALTWQAALRSERRRPWLLAHVAALLVAILLHPTAALLAPITLVTLLLARNRPRRWEYLASAGMVALLLVPTVLFEIVSQGSDITVFARYLAAPKKLDLEVFYRLYAALGTPVDQLGSLKPQSGLLGQLRLLLDTPKAAIFTSGSLYATLGPLWVVCATALFLLAALGWLVLTSRVATPIIAQVRATQNAVSLPPIATRLRDLWRDLRTQDGWQQDLMLWLWVTLPIALMLRHTGPVKPHYLMVLYPGIFVVMAQGIIWLYARATNVQHAIARFGRVAAMPASLVILTFVVLLCGEVSQSAAVFEGIDLGQFSAVASHYGYLLSDMQASDAQIANFALATGALSTTILLDPNFEKPLSYLLVAGHAGRIGVEDTCLIVPPADATPSLVVATRPTSQSSQLLETLPNVSPIGTIQMRGGKPFQVYAVRGQTPALLPGEQRMGGVPFAATNSPDLRLDALAAVAPGLLRLRWTMLQSTAAGQLPFGFRILLRWRGAAGQLTGPENFADCAPSRWQAGSTVFTWLRVPSASTATLVMMLRRRIVAPAITTLGSVRLLAASVDHPPFIALHAQTPTSVLPAVQLSADGVDLSAKAFGIAGS